MDIKLVIIYLTLHRNCTFLATHVGVTSWNREILLSLVESTRAGRAGKFDSESYLIVRKVKSNKLVHLEWFRNYLTNRKQFVTYNNCKSDVGVIQCGVPQGLVLGPLLFIIFINDIAFSSNSMSFFYLFRWYQCYYVAPWSRSTYQFYWQWVIQFIALVQSKLSLNVSKTNYMIFKNRHSNRIYDNTHIFIDGTELTKVSHTKFLGVFIDESFTWEKHNSYVTNIVSKYSGILFRLKQLLQCTTLFSLYNTLVLPHLYYCNIIWADSNNCNLNSILVKQKRIVHTLYKFFLACTYTPFVLAAQYTHYLWYSQFNQGFVHV